MAATDILQQIGESLGSSASVKAVFGEPIHAAGRTVVPVAKVAYAFGGGFGTDGKAASESGRHGGRRGGGAPAGRGALGARMAGAFAAGAVLGGLILGNRRRR